MVAGNVRLLQRMRGLLATAMAGFTKSKISLNRQFWMLPWRLSTVVNQTTFRQCRASLTSRSDGSLAP